MSLARPAALLSLAFAVACSGTGIRVHRSRTGPPSREEMTATVDSMVAGGRFKGELWRLNLAERFGSSVHAKEVTVDGDLLLIEDDAHRLHGIDRASGAHRWFIEELPGTVTQTVGGTGGALAVISTDDVVAVTRKSGSRLTGTERVPQSEHHLQFFPSGRAVVIGKTAFVGRLAPSSLQSLDLAGGRNGWSYATSSPVVDTVVYGDGAVAQVISVTEDGLLVSLPPRAANESAWAPPEKWHRRLAGVRVVTPLTLVGDSLIFGSNNAFLYHVDVRTGAIRWKVGCGSEMSSDGATIAGGAVYQHADDGIHAFDLASGTELWTAEGATRAITQIGERVYLESGRMIRVVDAKSGHEISQFDAQHMVMPTLQGGGALYGCDGTNVIALQ